MDANADTSSDDLPTRRQAVGAAAGMAMSMALAGTAAAKPAARRKPNFVIVLADDLGYGDLSCFGHPTIRTPNLDRMAKEGVRLTDFYVAGPVCTPSRAGLLTARYPLRSGLTRVLFPNSPGGIEDNETTLGAALRGCGYATACIGKWHVGCLPQFLPTRHGFDSYFGIPYSNDMTPRPLLRNEETLEEPVPVDTLTRRYTEEAVSFIRSHRDRPFFLYLAHTMPHVPLGASARFLGRSPRGLYGDVVQEIDWSVGEVLATLKETGLDRDTLVFFTSDNGPWLIQGENGGSAGPLRGGKGTTWEGGMREPTVARWPGRIPAALECSDPAITLDLLPTLVRLAGGKPPNAKPIDGRDISKYLFGKGHPARREILYYNNETLEAIRVRDLKLHLERTVQGRLQPALLYDLRADIGETNDLAADRPADVERLAAIARRMDADVRRGASDVKRV